MDGPSSSETPTEASDAGTCDDRPRPEPTTAGLRSVGLAAGLAAVGVTDVSILEPAHSVLPTRRAAGLAATMQFTYRNPARSTDPSLLLSNAASLVVGVFDYGPLSRDAEDRPSNDALDGELGFVRGRVARYARVNAYDRLRDGLQAVAAELATHGHRTRIVADDNALVDRNAAWRAGLGWYGKNTNLLVGDAGSWFVIGAVATDAVLDADSPPMSDGCGSCSVCLDDCPTDALVAPGVLDARRCISWLVQAGEPIPVEHRVAVDDWLYGCDICQDVCPPNRVVIRRRAAQRDRRDGDQSIAPQTQDEELALDWVLTASNADLLERFGHWYIANRDPDVIRRTAIVVLGNRAPLDDPATRELVGRYLHHPSAFLRGHAVWAARRLHLDDLAEATRSDPDPTVRAEWDAPVPRRVGPESL
jgi:epoxyqueuosine reductase